jgi:hypothetical protein
MVGILLVINDRVIIAPANVTNIGAAEEKITLLLISVLKKTA